MNEDKTDPNAPPTSKLQSAAGRADLDARYAGAVGEKKAHYYVPKFLAYEDRGVRVSWNWPAFFVSWWWLLYRKMWRNAVLYFLLPIPFGLVSMLAGGWAYLPFLILIFIVFPLYANGLYFAHVRRILGQVSASQTDDASGLARIVATGGTSTLIAILAGVFIVVPACGIVATVAIPARQDYTLWAILQQSVRLSQPHRVASVIACSEGVISNNPSHGDLGLDPPRSYAGPYTEEVVARMRDPSTMEVVVRLKAIGDVIAAGDQIVYVGVCGDSEMRWRVEGTVPRKYLPKI